MKRILALTLALVLMLSLAACGGKGKDDNGSSGDGGADLTAQEIMDALQKQLGDSFDCDMAEDADRMSAYWGLDMSKIESWAAMSNSNASINPSTAVVLQVKDGYAQDAAALLQSGYEQMLSYARMYDMDLQKVLQARLFVNGNCVALLILGAEGDWEASEEAQAQFASQEAAKVDSAWKAIFGSAKNSITIPAGSTENAFDMSAAENG